MKSNAARNESKSLKTFFIYTVIVFIFIFISLTVKAFLIVKESRFDGKNQFIIAIAKNKTVKEVVVIHPLERSAVLINLKGKDVQVASLAQTLGIIIDGKVDTSLDLPSENIAATMRAITFHYYSLKTNLTIFDVVRLMFVAQKVSANNQTTEEILLSDNNESDSANLFTDEKIFSENISVQIINASGTPGIGNRLERALTNLGSNVISVSTSRSVQRQSKIQFFGEETYTLNKLESLLAFPIENTQNQTLADIVITIGEDNKRPENF